MQSKQNRDLDCVICLDLPRKTISCNGCRKLFCSKHLPKLNKICPHCRSNPLQFKYQEQLQIQIQKKRKNIREEEKNTKQFKCFIKNCLFQGYYKQMQEHKNKNHQNRSMDQILYGDEQLEFKPTTKQIQIASFAANNDRMPPPGQKKKSPDYNQALRMIRHVNNCKNQSCKSLWTGRWGSFIGGEKGSLYFDLTDCQIGRQLNEAVGWVYGQWRN